MTWNKCKDTANGALRDAEFRFYQGVFYVQNVILLHGTRLNVRQLTPTQKAVWPFLRRFSGNSQMLNSITCRSFVPNGHLTRAENVESTDRNVFKPLINLFLWTCSATNFFKFGGKMGTNPFTPLTKVRPAFAAPISSTAAVGTALLHEQDPIFTITFKSVLHVSALLPTIIRHYL
jgi:hypothetical protein